MQKIRWWTFPLIIWLLFQAMIQIMLLSMIFKNFFKRLLLRNLSLTIVNFFRLMWQRRSRHWRKKGKIKSMCCLRNFTKRLGINRNKKIWLEAVEADIGENGRSNLCLVWKGANVEAKNVRRSNQCVAWKMPPRGLELAEQKSDPKPIKVPNRKLR